MIVAVYRLQRTTTSAVMSYVMSVMRDWNKVWKGAGMMEQAVTLNDIVRLCLICLTIHIAGAWGFLCGYIFAKVGGKGQE